MCSETDRARRRTRTPAGPRCSRPPLRLERQPESRQAPNSSRLTNPTTRCLDRRLVPWPTPVISVGLRAVRGGTRLDQALHRRARNRPTRQRRVAPTRAPVAPPSSVASRHHNDSAGSYPDRRSPRRTSASAARMGQVQAHGHWLWWPLRRPRVRLASPQSTRHAARRLPVDSARCGPDRAARANEPGRIGTLSDRGRQDRAMCGSR